MKTKFKIILMAIIMLLAILFIGNSKVQAANIIGRNWEYGDLELM